MLVGPGKSWQGKVGSIVVETDGLREKTLLRLRKSIVNRVTFLKEKFCQNQHKTE